MTRIPLPIPDSTGTKLVRLVRGPVVDLVWVTFVTLVITSLAYLLVAVGGVVGGVIAGTALGTVYNDNVRKAIKDIYARDFWVWRVD